jgi:hypothetical protein
MYAEPLEGNTIERESAAFEAAVFVVGFSSHFGVAR